MDVVEVPPPSVQVTVLGSGTSMGVPTVGCECAVCRSTDPHDHRTRASILLSYNGRNVVIDTTPDFRYQALRAGIKRLDAVVFTHGHADHILGLDDVRPFNLKQQAALPVFASDETLEILRRTFSYIFHPGGGYSTVPQVELHPIRGPLNLFGLELIPIPAIHGDLDVLGFRFGRAAYLTDFSRLPASSKPLLHDLDDLILDALRYTPHPMHSNVEQSLALVDEARPRRAWFTHICHDLPHAETNAKLAQHPGHGPVRLAHDGLTFSAKAAGLSVSASAGRLRVFHSPEEWVRAVRQAAFLTVGSFDGLHVGHRAILQAVAERARSSKGDCIAGAVTFDPHPLKTLKPAEAPPLIATLAQRLAGFEQIGIDSALVLQFSPVLSRLSPEDFIRTILVEQLRVRGVLVGENFRFGHQQSGDIGVLQDLGRKYGFSVEIAAPVQVDGETVSSTAVRRAIREGDVTRAARLLGRPFELTGSVEPGAGKGRQLLFPTLNLACEQELLPNNGVYVTETLVDGGTYRSATNVGVRPTMGGSRLTVECHLFDFSRDVTSGRMEIRFYQRLRDEQRFDGVESLRQQIQRDLAAAREFFAQNAR